MRSRPLVTARTGGEGGCSWRYLLGRVLMHVVGVGRVPSSFGSGKLDDKARWGVALYAEGLREDGRSLNTDVVRFRISLAARDRLDGDGSADD